MKKFTRERVVPTISASVSCDSFGRDALGLVLLPVPGQQQQGAGESLLAGVEELIDQILFDSDVARQHVREEPVGECRMFVQHPDHVALGDSHEGRPHDGRRRSHAQGLPGQAALAQEIARPEHGDHGLLAGRGQDGQLDSALLDEKHASLRPLGERRRRPSEIGRCAATPAPT